MEVAVQISMNWPEVKPGRAERPDHREIHLALSTPTIATMRKDVLNQPGHHAHHLLRAAKIWIWAGINTIRTLSRN